MGSMGRIIKLKSTTMEMPIQNHSADDKITDRNVAGDNNHNNINLDDEECLVVDEFACEKELRKACYPLLENLPRKRRTPLVDFGKLTYDFQEDVYYFHSNHMIMDRKDSSESDKRSRDEDIIDDEKNSRKTEKCSRDEEYIMDAEKNSRELDKPSRDEEYIMDAEKNSRRTEKCSRDEVDIMDDEKNSRRTEKRSRDEDYVLFDDDFEEGESSKKKRPKKVEKKKTTVPRKQPVPINLPTELPQNLQDYISGLDLEAPPLFVAQKHITVTDILSHQSRLSLPKTLINSEFLDNFLTEGEKGMLEKMNPIEVNLVDGQLREFYDLHMTQWETNKTIVLRKVWNKVAEQNNLEPLKVLKDNKASKIVGMKNDNQWKTDVVAQVWCFRKESKIWFALHTQAMTELTILGMTEDQSEKCYIIM